jgi:hypothetical protein
MDDLHMVSATDGWALVWSANPARNAVLEAALTRDAGRSWTVVTPMAAQALLDNGEALLYAASARRAWIAVNHGDGKSTVVFGTSDGGQSWTESNPVVGYQAVAMDFAGADHGWLLESQGAAMGQDPVRVYVTADGGVTWSLLASGLPVECGKTGMAFSPAQVGWITSDCVLGYQVLVSRDGGAQWATAQLPLPNSACADGCTAFQAQFAGPGTTLEVGSYPAAGTAVREQRRAVRLRRPAGRVRVDRGRGGPVPDGGLGADLDSPRRTARRTGSDTLGHIARESGGTGLRGWLASRRPQEPDPGHTGEGSRP